MTDKEVVKKERPYVDENNKVHGCDECPFEFKCQDFCKWFAYPLVESEHYCILITDPKELEEWKKDNWGDTDMRAPMPDTSKYEISKEEASKLSKDNEFTDEDFDALFGDNNGADDRPDEKTVVDDDTEEKLKD